MIEDVAILIPVQKKSKMHLPGHRGFPIGPKNTNLIEDVEILSSFVKLLRSRKLFQPIRGKSSHLKLVLESAQNHIHVICRHRG